MTPKQQLLQEIGNMPNALVPDVLSYLRFIKAQRLAQRLAQQTHSDVMQFAGMLVETPSLADSIIEDAQINRDMDL